MAMSVQYGVSGRGVFTDSPIAGGSRVLRYSGPLLHYAQTTPATLALQIGLDLYLGESGGLDDFVNHSCYPNCGIRIGRAICNTDEAPEVQLISLRDITAGEELTFDYSTTMDEDDFEFDCACGSPLCRRRIRDFKHLPAELHQRYAQLGVVPDYNMAYLKDPANSG